MRGEPAATYTPVEHPDTTDCDSTCRVADETVTQVLAPLMCAWRMRVGVVADTVMPLMDTYAEIGHGING